MNATVPIYTSTEIIIRTREISNKIKILGNMALTCADIPKLSNAIVEFNKFKLELQNMTRTGQNDNAIDSAVIIMDFHIKSCQSWIGVITKQHLIPFFNGAE